MKSTKNNHTRARLIDRVMEGAIVSSGAVLVLIIIAIFFYLAHESKYAFDRKFDYGFRFAMQPVLGEKEADVSLDPYASILTANKEGGDGVDEKEEGITMPNLEEFSGVVSLGTGTSLGDSPTEDNLYRDDWRPMQRADKGQNFRLYGFATPEYTEPTMQLAWQPDASFDPSHAPYNLKLKLVSGPAEPFEIDLKQNPSGSVTVPTYIAQTDDDRTKGYVFELVAEPETSNFMATVGGFFRTSWDPTLAYPRYGFVPLLLGTLAITILAMLIATPIGAATAIFLSEFASVRVREWAKPVLELLASVPTVVLGYLGLMLVAPALQETLAAALSHESGRALLTTSIVMAVLLLPTIATVAEDALRGIPTTLRDGGEALGLTTGEGVKKVVLPAAKSGFIAALLLGTARAIGETMIVWILSGGTPGMPSFASAQDGLANLMKPTRGMADTVAIEMGNVDFEGVHYGHLFLLGLTLFVITLVLNLSALKLARRSAWRH
jgi:phosphate transport system permease protein